jgi:hypothetical protein
VIYTVLYTVTEAGRHEVKTEDVDNVETELEVLEYLVGVDELKYEGLDDDP